MRKKKGEEISVIMSTRKINLNKYNDFKIKFLKISKKDCGRQAKERGWVMERRSSTTADCSF